VRRDLQSNDLDILPNGRQNKKKNISRRRRRTVLRVLRNIFFSVVGTLVLFVVACYAVGFLTPWGNKQRLIFAETIISTRHYALAHYITTSKEYKELAKELHAPVYATTGNKVQVPTKAVSIPLQQAIEIDPISGPGYNGYVMLVHNPLLVRLVPAKVNGAMGEYITDTAKRVGAVAGTNASGFQDPNGNGWGGEAVGLVMSGGTVVHPSQAGSDWATVGFTDKGVMVMGQYAVSQLQKMGVRDAMQFHPELVVDGKPMITHGDGGWGNGPRTAIGQAKDGTVIFIVINGRFHGGSGMGASQKQVMNLMLQYGAVNACAMDGGSSSVLVHDGTIVNSPTTIDPNHQRHLPDAWMVFSSTSDANQIK